jgi:hypothetical protein
MALSKVAQSQICSQMILQLLHRCLAYEDILIVRRWRGKSHWYEWRRSQDCNRCHRPLIPRLNCHSEDRRLLIKTLEKTVFVSSLTNMEMLHRAQTWPGIKYEYECKEIKNRLIDRYRGVNLT